MEIQSSGWIEDLCKKKKKIRAIPSVILLMDGAKEAGRSHTNLMSYTNAPDACFSV